MALAADTRAFVHDGAGNSQRASGFFPQVHTNNTTTVVIAYRITLCVLWKLVSYITWQPLIVGALPCKFRSGETLGGGKLNMGALGSSLESTTEITTD